MRRATNRLCMGMLACAPVLFLSACADPLVRSDALWPYSGDAVAANRIAQTIDPWPRASRNTAFSTNGARVAESIVLTMFGASWAPAISFGMLLAVLAVRPQGLLGR